jgi:hypothetical protein
VAPYMIRPLLGRSPRKQAHTAHLQLNIQEQPGGQAAQKPNSWRARLRFAAHVHVLVLVRSGSSSQPAPHVCPRPAEQQAASHNIQQERKQTGGKDLRNEIASLACWLLLLLAACGMRHDAALLVIER